MKLHTKSRQVVRRRLRGDHCAAGQTLLELIMASVVMGIALVPALALMRDSMEISREIEKRELVTTFCTGKLEEHLAIGAANFTSGTASGSYTADGFPSFRFSVSRSDAVVDGGIVDRLMVVTATVWYDQDGDTTLDAGEIQVTMSSKIAKMAVYQGGGS